MARAQPGIQQQVEEECRRLFEEFAGVSWANVEKRWAADDEIGGPLYAIEETVLTDVDREARRLFERIASEVRKADEWLKNSPSARGSEHVRALERTVDAFKMRPGLPRLVRSKRVELVRVLDRYDVLGLAVPSGPPAGPPSDTAGMSRALVAAGFSEATASRLAAAQRPPVVVQPRTLTARELAIVSLLVGNWPGDTSELNQGVEDVIDRETKLIREARQRARTQGG